MPKFNRKTYDEKTKDRIIAAVRSGARTVTELAREEGLQPYQIYAWIGEQAIKSAGDTGTVPTLPLNMDALTEPDLERAIGQWYIRTHILKPSKSQR